MKLRLYVLFKIVKHIEKNISVVPTLPLLETVTVLLFIRTYIPPNTTNISLANNAYINHVGK